MAKAVPKSLFMLSLLSWGKEDFMKDLNLIK